MLKLFKKKEEFEEVEEINLFQVKTEDHTIQKYNNIFYVKNNDTGYVEELPTVKIKIK